MAVNTFGVDLGTGSIKIYNQVKKQVLNEKNMIAIEHKTKIFATGDAAYEMNEKAPAYIQISTPIQNGVIADIENMKNLFQEMMKKSGGSSMKNSDYIIAVPTDITEVEKRAFYDLVLMSNVKGKKVRFVEKPVADATGVGLDVNTAQGIMVVNVGADTTEISVLSLGGIVLSKLIQMGGNRFDESIQNIIKRQENLYIGAKTAELIKKELACAIPAEEFYMDVVGRDVVSGLPVSKTISSSLVEEAIGEQLFIIVDAIKMILERTPPELAADIIEHGIYLTGGSSSIQGFADLITNETELLVNQFEKPSESVIRGMERIIHEKQLANLSSEIKEKQYR